MKTNSRMHYCHPYLLNPTHPITVNLIGAGGTGSAMLTFLSKIHNALLKLGRPGLHVNVFDGDEVSEVNTIRQDFAECEIGLYKCVALVNRCNRFRGTSWKAFPHYFTCNDRQLMNRDSARANIYISCVDSVDARFEIEKAIMNELSDFSCSYIKPLYWMDLGNSRQSGQAFLSTLTTIKQPESKMYNTVSDLPLFTEEYREMLEAQDDTNQPSCSHYEALLKQDLMINPMIAGEAASLLWSLLSEGRTAYRGFFKNLGNYTATPVMV